MAAPSSVSLKEYLKRYQSGTDEPKKAKKKKNKEKLKSISTGGGVLVVDNDPIWQKPVQLDDAEEEDNFAGDETPQVEEDIEVKRMKRLEALRSVKPYHGINEDGSGWVSIPKPSRPSAAKGQDLSPQINKHDYGNGDLSPTDSDKDLSPPRQRRRRLDTPSPEPGLSRHGGEVRDLSPPRKRRIEDLSPPRHGKSRTQEVEAGRGSREDDLSPPRKPVKGAKKGPLEDLSPPRKARSSPHADLSPPRRIRKMSPDDLSPPRRAWKRSVEPTDMQSSSLPDLSHTTKGQFGSSKNSSAPRRVHHGSLEGSGNTNLPSAGPLPPRIKESSLTKEAKRGGILSGKEMREETDRKRMEEKSRFATMDPSLTGRGAEAVYRDKEGKKISKEELMKSKEKKKEVLRAMPVVDLKIPTLCLVGAPNVGKSSLVRILSTGKPEVCNYPFTTRGILMGHIAVNYERFQVTDTPGLLRRHDDDRNNLEKLTLAVLEYLPTAILYVHDLTGECGISPADQFIIYKDIKGRFGDHLWLDVVSKTDLMQEPPIDGILMDDGDDDDDDDDVIRYKEFGPDDAIWVSVKTEAGISELKSRVKDLLTSQMGRIRSGNCNHSECES